MDTSWYSSPQATGKSIQCIITTLGPSFQDYAHEISQLIITKIGVIVVISIFDDPFNFFGLPMLGFRVFNYCMLDCRC